MRSTTLGASYSRRLAQAAILATTVVAAACLSNEVTGTRPLSMTVTASSATVAAGDSVGFEFSATGTGIVLMVMNYGDATADTLTFSGPLGIAGLLWHTYEAQGEYTVVGETTGVNGSISDSVTVTVN